jgi:hypothetical protein
MTTIDRLLTASDKLLLSSLGCLAKLVMAKRASPANGLTTTGNVSRRGDEKKSSVNGDIFTPRLPQQVLRRWLS